MRMVFLKHSEDLQHQLGLRHRLLFKSCEKRFNW